MFYSAGHTTACDASDAQGHYLGGNYDCIGVATLSGSSPAGTYTPIDPNEPLACGDDTGSWSSAYNSSATSYFNLGGVGGLTDPQPVQEGNQWYLEVKTGNYFGGPSAQILAIPFTYSSTSNSITSFNAGAKVVLKSQPIPSSKGGTGCQGYSDQTACTLELNNTIEAPDLFDQNSQNRYLFFSAGTWSTTNYSTGYATCPIGSLSTCHDDDQLILSSTNTPPIGPGGESVFVDQNGDPWIVYAGWNICPGPSNGQAPQCTLDANGNQNVGNGTSGSYRQLWTSPLKLPDVFSAMATTHDSRGYWLAQQDGTVWAFGDATAYGSMTSTALNSPIVGMAPTPDGLGYWLVAADGGIFAFGDAHFYGSMGGKLLNKPIVGMASTPDGLGYWLVASDGGVFSFGDAGFYGSTGDITLNRPVVGMASTSDGKGYWMDAQDGGIFAFGDASFYGSMGGKQLNTPVVGMAPTPDGKGYWEDANDGGIFSFGTAQFYGSMGGRPLNKPLIAMAATNTGTGYWEVASDGGIFSFGTAQFYGSMGGAP